MTLHGLIKHEQSAAWRELETDFWKVESLIRYTPVRELDFIKVIGMLESLQLRRDALLKEKK